MVTLFLMLDVAGGHSLCTLLGSIVIVGLQEFVIQQPRKHILKNSVGMLLLKPPLGYFNFLEQSFSSN